jgi:hypothetical protein
MRPYYFVLAFLFLLGNNSFSQTIYKVDSNPNAPTGDHVYSDLQECIDAASDGDIIQIIPAVETYGAVQIDKELHLVGSGRVPDNQSGLTSKISSIVFESNAANGGTLNGLVLLDVNSYPITFGLLNAPLDTLKDIEIYNCKIAGIEQLSNCPVKNITLRNNVIAGLINNTGSTETLNFEVSDGATVNLVIANNIIMRASYSFGGGFAAINAANQTVIKNNIFIWVFGTGMFGDVHDCFITNNVFYASSANGTINYANVYSNNLSYYCSTNCTLPPPSTSVPSNSGSGNLGDTDPLYTNGPTYPYYPSVLNNTLDLSISEFSPLIDAGTDGTNIGVMGGQYPFVNYHNLRGVPYIHQLSVPGLIMENQDIELEAEARNNQ